MAHLPARGGGSLAVEVKLDAGVGPECGVPAGLAVGPEVAQQVDHGRGHDQVGRAQRQTAEGAHLLLELAGDAGLDRQMPRVVRPRGDLVDQQTALGRQEELDAEHADGPQRLGHGQGQRAGLERDDRTDGGRHHGRVQDVPLVPVQADRIGDRLAVVAAGDDHRDLGRELDPPLGHARHVAQARPCGVRIGRPVDQHLSLAVVARAGGLEDEGKTQGAHGGVQLVLGPDRPPGSKGNRRSGRGRSSRGAGSG